MDRARLASQVDSTLEVLLGHKRVHTAAMRANHNNALRRALINVATTRANRTALAIWAKCIAVPAAMPNQGNVRLVHARRLHQIKPRVMGELQTRLWW